MEIAGAAVVEGADGWVEREKAEDAGAVGELGQGTRSWCLVIADEGAAVGVGGPVEDGVVCGEGGCWIEKLECGVVVRNGYCEGGRGEEG